MKKLVTYGFASRAHSIKERSREMAELDALRYPVGPMPRRKEPLDRATRAQYIDAIAATPARVRSLVTGRADRELDAPYRPGGWTVRQVVHHVPDSHMNAYIRTK